MSLGYRLEIAANILSLALEKQAMQTDEEDTQHFHFLYKQ
jgi:hypothetical protein